MEWTWKGLGRGVGRKASDSSGGLSSRPAEELRRGENVEAEAKLSEAAEENSVQKAEVEEKPVEVRIRQ